VIERGRKAHDIVEPEKVAEEFGATQRHGDEPRRRDAESKLKRSLSRITSVLTNTPSLPSEVLN
jgi:hypothetical protein